MEELSTPVEAVVEDTSVAQEPVETTDVTTDTSDTVTEPEATTNEPMAETTTEGEQAPAEQEKLYAGKYKSVEELEKGYKETEKAVQRAAELEKQLKAYQDKQPKYVTDEGKINPELKVRYDQVVDNQEFLTYAELARSLDVETRAEVEKLLGEAQRVYNPRNKQAYISKLTQAKNYFNSDVVESIAKNKSDLQAKADAEMRSYEQKARQEKAMFYQAEVQKQPELYNLVNPDSESYSPEVFNILKSSFDAYGNIDIPQTLKAIESIKALGVKEYQAKQEFEANKQKAVINTGDKVSTQNPSLPSAKEVTENYQKYINKYMKDGMTFNDAMAKVDAIIMKG